jgi:serine acetyltransferase
MDVMARIAGGLRSRLRIALFRARGVQIRGHVRLERVSIPRNHGGLTLLPGVALDDGVVILLTHKRAIVEIGRNCYINRHTMLDVSEELRIGDECMVGPFCYLTDHDHTFGGGIAPGASELISRPTHIGERCWIGAHATILKGVTIGNGTVVGAGSVVTKSLPEGVVAAGNPAQILRKIPA